MKTILIDGVIGWDVFNSTIRKSLEDADGDEVMIEISSPGGFVYEGLSIFNSIRDYSRNKNSVTVKLTGLAASMASYIAMAGDRVISEDNAIFMIHNAWGGVIGDYREMKKAATEIEKLTDLLANAYSKKTGKDKKKIRKLMDDESFYYGEEALKAGFVDEMIDSKDQDNSLDKDSMILVAKGRINDCFNKMRESEKAKNDLDKAAALISEISNNINKNDTQLTDNSDDKQDKKIQDKKQEVKMTLDVLKRDHPDLYNEVYTNGVNDERKRVKAHITLGRKSGATDKMFSFIDSGASISDQDVQAEYLAAGMNNQDKNNRLQDDENLGNLDSNKQIDDGSIALASFEKALSDGGNDFDEEV